MLENDGGMTVVSAPKVLIIEDDEAVGQALVGALDRSGMRTAWATTGAEGLLLKKSFMPDVVLVDLNLPDTNGIGLVTYLSQQGECGVIIVSGMGDEADRIVGLEIGADDYVSKPPHLRELLARIRAVYRRVKLRAAAKSEVTTKSVVQVGKLTIDLSSRSIYTQSGEKIALTAAEFTALETMLAANGEPVSRDRISEAALRRPWRAEDRSVDQLIFNLRQKLSGTDENRLIHSIRGAGYLLAVRSGTNGGAPARAPAEGLIQAE
jgi:two-component system, OmpR family, response regulator